MLVGIIGCGTVFLALIINGSCHIMLKISWCYINDVICLVFHMFFACSLCIPNISCIHIHFPCIFCAVILQMQPQKKESPIDIGKMVRADLCVAVELDPRLDYLLDEDVDD